MNTRIFHRNPPSSTMRSKRIQRWDIYKKIKFIRRLHLLITYTWAFTTSNHKKIPAASWGLGLAINQRLSFRVGGFQVGFLMNILFFFRWYQSTSQQKQEFVEVNFPLIQFQWDSRACTEALVLVITQNNHPHSLVDSELWEYKASLLRLNLFWIKNQPLHASAISQL